MARACSTWRGRPGGGCVRCWRCSSPSAPCTAGGGRDVPFRIANRLENGRAISARRFGFARRAWVMRDSVGLNAHGRLVDEIGHPICLVASFEPDVREGALILTSRAVGIRIGRVRLRLPRAVAPVVTLHEGFDAPTGGQRIRLTVDAPLVGRIYEYGGTFRYRIEEES